MERITDMTPTESCRVGAWLPIVARAVMKTAGVMDFNVIQNNGICFMGLQKKGIDRGLVAYSVLVLTLNRHTCSTGGASCSLPYHSAT